MISIRSVGLTVLIAVGLSMSMTVNAATAAPNKKADTPLQRLNIAEQQEMLAERLTRTWAMSGITSLRGHLGSRFDEDSRRYLHQLKYLQAEADTPELKDTYAQLEQLWAQYLVLTETEAGMAQSQARGGEASQPAASNQLGGSVKSEGGMPAAIKAIADQNDKLVTMAAKGSELIRQRIPPEQSEGLRLAGQARTLSQRMTRLYFFRALGVTAPSIAADLKKSEAAYLTVMKRLRELSDDRPKSYSALSLVDQQWIFFSEILQSNVGPEERDQTYQTFARTSDSLLSGLDDLCASFEVPAPPAP
jgi:hypothetical protein